MPRTQDNDYEVAQPRPSLNFDCAASRHQSRRLSTRLAAMFAAILILVGASAIFAPTLVSAGPGYCSAGDSGCVAFGIGEYKFATSDAGLSDNFYLTEICFPCSPGNTVYHQVDAWKLQGTVYSRYCRYFSAGYLSVQAWITVKNTWILASDRFTGSLKFKTTASC